MKNPVVHVVGAGLAGLAAAARLTKRSRRVILYDAARQAGGRCRSYYDQTLGMIIDNGNHLLLSGNHAARDFLSQVGGADQMRGPAEAEFAFLDLPAKQFWRLRPNGGPFPWWIFSAQRRAPGTSWRDYLSLLPLLVPGPDRPIKAAIDCEGPVYEYLWRPFLLAALNTEPAEGSRRLAAAVVRETLARGGRACRPLIAAHGLSAAFIEPAQAFLLRRGVEIRLDHRLRRIEFGDGRVRALDFGDARVELGEADEAILAVPAQIAQELVPDLSAPQSFCAIVNAHFKIAAPAGLPPILGLIGGLAEWLFAFEDRLSVTISGADRLIDVGREELAAKIWAEIAEAARLCAPRKAILPNGPRNGPTLGDAPPPWQIIKEKRATFAATPEENLRRPGAQTPFANLVLAGDWTATGLPATIEGAIRSGNRAAALVGRSSR